jgi:hypothetical protein
MIGGIIAAIRGIRVTIPETRRPSRYGYEISATPSMARELLEWVPAEGDMDKATSSKWFWTENNPPHAESWTFRVPGSDQPLGDHALADAVPLPPPVTHESGIRLVGAEDDDDGWEDDAAAPMAATGT